MRRPNLRAAWAVTVMLSLVIGATGGWRLGLACFAAGAVTVILMAWSGRRAKAQRR